MQQGADIHQENNMVQDHELLAQYTDDQVDWLHLIAEQERQAQEDEAMIQDNDEQEHKTFVFWLVFLLCITAAASLISYIHLHV